MFKTFSVPSLLCLTLLLVIGLAASTLIHASPGDPIAQVDLSGTWTFTPQGQSQTTIQVPGGGWVKQGFTNVNEADYQRSITIPNAGVPQVTKIEFGAVNCEASLYINSTLVGTNNTCFTPSEFDITNYVTPGQTYTLRVHVKGFNKFNTGANGWSVIPGAATWSPYRAQGIYRSAFIKVYQKAYLSDAFVTTSVTNNSLTYDVWVTNKNSTACNLTLSGNLTSWNGSGWTYPSIGDTSFTVPAAVTSKITVGPITWGLGTGSYWWPNVPYQSGYRAQLHNLNLTLKEGATVRSTKTVRFGFRETSQINTGSATYYYLNGIRVNYRGDSLQPQNYDGINYGGGRGDAIDTYPGFLPGASGWPKVVDNYQKLNYNVVRMHQIPATDYMLDVTDEMGLMVISEPGIRGGAQDFSTGHDYMVNHLKALVLKDRNHCSVVRWSQANEPDLSGSLDSVQFETDLYNAIMSLDQTRPISIDAGRGTAPYNEMNYSNFSVIPHYLDGYMGVTYTESVIPRTDRPFGQGEFIWCEDNTSGGFAWFATSTQALRRKDASDIRPYTLLSAWISLVPGVHTYDLTLERGMVGWGSGVPLYGEDNLPDPWSNRQIKRVQAAFNPVLIADRQYWENTKMSNGAGEWPANIPCLTAGQPVTRTLDIYNDTFSGTTVDVYWEVRKNSPAGTLVQSGELHPSITPGSKTSSEITFVVPNESSGTPLYLVLIGKKSGAEIFRENDEKFLISSYTMANDDAGGMSYSGTWYDDNNRTDEYNSDLHYTATNGNYVQYTFTGIGVDWINEKADNLGNVKVYIDGSLDTTVNLYNPTKVHQRTVYNKGLASGTHTIKLEKQDGSWMSFDALKIYQGGGATPTPTPAPGAATVNDSVTGTGNNQFEYVGTWYSDAGRPSAYNSDEHYSETNNDYVQLAFNGTQVKYYSSTNYNMGKAGVSIDGGAETVVDFYSPSQQWQQLIYTSPALSAGNHTLKVRLNGQKNGSSSGYWVCADKVEIMSGGGATPTPTPTPVNLAQNPGFETTGSWSTYGAAGRVNSNAHSGSYSMRATPANDGAWQTVTVSPNTTYTLKAWGKKDSTLSNLMMYVKNYGGSELQSYFTSTSYTQQTITFTTGTGITSCEIGFWAWSGSGYGYGDDFELVAQ